MVVWNNGCTHSGPVIAAHADTNCTPGDIHDLGRQLLRLQAQKVPRGHDDYEFDILAKYQVFFEPYPRPHPDLADKETLAILSYVLASVPVKQMKPLQLASRREISPEDKEFVLRIMKMDPRDRLTAKELLEDEWFDHRAAS